MVTEKIRHNAADIAAELNWFRKILEVRSKLNSKEECGFTDVYQVEPPSLANSKSTFASFINKRKFGFEERFLLALAMVPHIKPELLDMFMAKNRNTQQVYTEFGGRRGKNHSGFIPTGETAMFILAGNNLQRRFSILRAFDSSHVFSKENLLRLDDVESGEPMLSGALLVSKEVQELFTTGEYSKPVFSLEFPAKLLSTRMEWTDLVITDHIQKQLRQIETWILNRDILMKEWGMEKYLRPGFKVLFHGPPGTGKTVTASLLGKKTGRDVYRIDLSQTVSKYIGETEKNLAALFDRAENKDWILFFDEADALFGKRTNTKDAHDRYANQQVSYLLQRIEDHSGLVILATNLKDNIDDAFLRRFQLMVYFPMPGADERTRLWAEGFGRSVVLNKDVDLKKIAREFEISGGTIMNVIQHAMLNTLERKSNRVLNSDIIEGVKREYSKLKRTI